MIKLNLLPLREKEKLKLGKLQKQIYVFLFWLVCVLIVFIGLLITIYFILQIMLQGQKDLIEQRETSQKNQEISLMKQRVNQLNQRLNSVDQKQQNSFIWTSILIKFSKLTPNQIYLTSFNYQQTNQELQVSGYAQNRDALLAFEEKLKNSSYFTNLESPLTNIIKQNNINFSFKLTPVSQKDLTESVQ